LRVERSLSVDLSAALPFAAMWTLVIYDSARLRTVAAIDSAGVAIDHKRVGCTLPPGNYAVILRCYDPPPGAVLPPIKVDGAVRVPPRALTVDASYYLEGLRDRRSIFYGCLHYHVYAMLRCRRFLPEEFVRRNFLPVGNPETTFLYGAIDRGMVLKIECPGGIQGGHRLYLTSYNYASFPVSWTEISGSRHVTAPMPVTGYFLLRIHRANATAETVDPARFQLATC
jgi:hypothetical protein